MKEVKKVLVALCLSEFSQGVFDHAARTARAFGADLIAINILNVRSVQDVSVIESLGYKVNSENYQETLLEERRRSIEDLVRKNGLAPESVKIMVKVGHPVDRILKIINEENVDLVIIGAKGRSNLEHLLVGSVAEKIFRHSPVTVISYRDKRLE